MIKDLQFLPASLLAQGIRDGVFTAREALDASIDEVKRRNKDLNAIVTLDEAGARRRAIEADEALAQGDVWGPLHGLPVTVPDDVDVSAMRSTHGDPEQANRIAKEDAGLVGRLRKAGAIVMGKTNVSPVTRGASTANPVFGRTHNPWDGQRSPGAGAGGGAAAVSAGLSALDFGADFCGSLRIPAALCGVYAFKVTSGRVALDGMATPDQVFQGAGGGQVMEPLSAAGLQARFVQDLKLAYSVLVSAAEPARAEIKFKKRRIAWTDAFGDFPVSAEIKTAIQQFAEAAGRQGAQVECKQSPGIDVEKIWEIGGALTGGTDHAGQNGVPRLFRRFFGSKGKLEGPGAALLRGLAAGPEMVRTREGLEQLMLERRSISTAFDRFFTDWDAWICPVYPTAAVPNEGTPGGERSGNAFALKIDVDGQPVSQLAAGLAFNVLCSLTGNPSIVLPITQSKTGLPIGVQLIGRRGMETDLLALADALSEIGCGYQRQS